MNTLDQVRIAVVLTAQVLANGGERTATDRQLICDGDLKGVADAFPGTKKTPVLMAALDVLDANLALIRPLLEEDEARVTALLALSDLAESGAPLVHLAAAGTTPLNAVAVESATKVRKKK